jgi:hypothetical protein
MHNYDVGHQSMADDPMSMGCERIELSRKTPYFKLQLTPEVYALLKDYAEYHNTTMLDAGNRILIQFFTRYHDFTNPTQFIRDIRAAIFPDRKSIYDALVSLIHRGKTAKRPLPLRKNGKLPPFLTKPESSDRSNG